MALIMGLEGLRGTTGLRALGVRGLGMIPPAQATTLAGLYGTADIIKRHPLLILAGLVFGGYWATRRAEGKSLLPDAWGEERLRQARAKALHGTRRRRR